MLLNEKTIMFLIGSLEYFQTTYTKQDLTISGQTFKTNGELSGGKGVHLRYIISRHGRIGPNSAY